jgi:hypothetical protein
LHFSVCRYTRIVSLASLALAALAVMLAGCVVVPARPMYVHVPRVVVY